MALTRDARERSRRKRRSPVASLELRRVEQKWLSRQLHDELGPSLCAAGLQLSLLRTETANMPADCAAALENVQAILERAVELARLLSYSVNPESAARCGIRDMVRMMARSFRAEVPETETVPRVEGPAAVELAEQLLDSFLLLDETGGGAKTRVLLLEDSVVLDTSGRRQEEFLPVTQRPLRHWHCELRERPRLNRTTLTWSLDQVREK